MSVQAIAWAIGQDVKPAAAKLCLIVLANYADATNRCWPSKSTIARDCSADKSWVCRQIAMLRDAGLISVQERTVDGANTTSIITLNVHGVVAQARQGGSGADATGGLSRGSDWGGGAGATGVVEPARHRSVTEPSIEPVIPPNPPMGGTDDRSRRDSSEDRSGMPAHVKPVPDMRTVFGVSDDGSGISIEPTTGAVRMTDRARREWVGLFGDDAGSLDLALIEVAGQLQPHSRRSMAAQVSSQLARIARDKRGRDARYREAVDRNKAPPRGSQSPTWVAESDAKRAAFEQALKQFQ